MFWIETSNTQFFFFFETDEFGIADVFQYVSVLLFIFPPSK